jgi:hypothetical protein
MTRHTAGASDWPSPSRAKPSGAPRLARTITTFDRGGRFAGVIEHCHPSGLRNTVKTRMFYARKRLAKLLSTHRDFDHLTALQAA